MSDSLNNQVDKFAVDSILPQTKFEGNTAILFFRFSNMLDDESYGLPVLREFVESACDPDDMPIEETALSINVNYSEIPDDFLEANSVGNGPDHNGVFHMSDALRPRVDDAIAGLETALKKLKDVKFHPGNE
jgi:hypothetical protein